MPFTKRASRRLIAIPVLIFCGCLAASAVSSTGRACAGRAGSSDAGPSKLDYLVLASIADSPQLLAMAAYRPQE